MSHRYFIVYKPYGMLSQFSTADAGKRTLGELFDFPKDVYPVGRKSWTDPMDLGSGMC